MRADDLGHDGHLRPRVERAGQRQRFGEIARLHGRRANGDAAHRFDRRRFGFATRARGGAHGRDQTRHQ